MNSQSNKLSKPEVSIDDAREFADVIRRMIFHENALRDHRVTWLLTSQAILFTAAGIVIERGLTNKESLAVVPGLLGIAIAIMIWRQLYVNHIAIGDLRRRYRDFKSTHQDVDWNLVAPVIGLDDKRLATQGSNRKRFSWGHFHAALPIAFIVAWFAAAMIVL